MTPAMMQRAWPFGLAIIAAGVAAFVAAECLVEPLPVALPAGTMTFGVVVSGFVATQRNMLLTMSGAEVLRFAVRAGFYRDVMAYFADGIRAGLFVTTVSLTGFFIGTNNTLWVVWLSIQAGGVTLVVCLIARNEILVRRMVSRYLEENAAN